MNSWPGDRFWSVLLPSVFLWFISKHSLPVHIFTPPSFLLAITLWRLLSYSVLFLAVSLIIIFCSVSLPRHFKRFNFRKGDRRKKKKNTQGDLSCWIRFFSITECGSLGHIDFYLRCVCDLKLRNNLWCVLLFFWTGLVFRNLGFGKLYDTLLIEETFFKVAVCTVSTFFFMKLFGTFSWDIFSCWDMSKMTFGKNFFRHVGKVHPT